MLNALYARNIQYLKLKLTVNGRMVDAKIAKRRKNNEILYKENV